MPVKPLSASVLICERVLQEKDGVLTLVRVADLFHALPPKSEADYSIVEMRLVITCKFPTSDLSEHLVEVKLKRPDGNVLSANLSTNGSPFRINLGILPIPPIEGVPRGFTIALPWGVKALLTGLHEVMLLTDGEHVASYFFMLLLDATKLDDAV